MKKPFANLICAFVPIKSARRKLRHRLSPSSHKNAQKSTCYFDNRGTNNTITVVLPDGTESQYTNQVEGLEISIIGNNNKIKLHLPLKCLNSYIRIRNDDAEVEIGPSEAAVVKH